MHLQLSVTGEIAELPIESIEGDLTQTPAVAASGTTDMLFLGQQLKGVEFVVSDGDLWAAYTPGQLQLRAGAESTMSRRS